MKKLLLFLILLIPLIGYGQAEKDKAVTDMESKYASLLERFNFPLMGAVFELKDFRDVKGTFSINASLYEFLDAFKSQTGISVEVHSKLKTDNKFVQALDFDNYWGNSSGNEEAPTFYVNAIAEIAKELGDGRYEYFIQLTILPNDNLSGSHLLHGDKFIAMTTYLTDSVPKTTTYLSSMYLNIFVENALRKYADVKEEKKTVASGCNTAKNMIWIGQYDQSLSGESCYCRRRQPKDPCANVCCKVAADAMISTSGNTLPTRRIYLANLINQADLRDGVNIDLNKFASVYSHVVNLLKQEKPVLVGVYRNNIKKKDELVSPYNQNPNGGKSATMHFIVLIEHCVEEKTKKEYFRYYETGTKYDAQGKSKDNILSINKEKKEIYSEKYTLTEIRIY